MEPLTIFVDELKRLATTAHELAHGLLNSGRRSPVLLQIRIFILNFLYVLSRRDDYLHYDNASFFPPNTSNLFAEIIVYTMLCIGFTAYGDFIGCG